ncbi:MAG TPA: PIN domain-containing protein [Terriglobales bacterium]|nr:PIN domain-containing protein [Terriglobales bacterium]
MPAENRLFDTNVLVYAYDVSEKAKRRVARTFLDEVWDQGGGVITLQNLSEFFVVVTGKVQRPISVASARTIISDIARSSRWLVIDRQVSTMMTAMDLVARVRAPYWDALIAVCMMEHGVHTIVTENERDFKKIPNITVINPFNARVRS